ncbi:hypothetical protein Hdeb2414_s0005g00159211 [Helianthus debilis subsp. tardiflorus]
MGCIMLWSCSVGHCSSLSKCCLLLFKSTSRSGLSSVVGYALVGKNVGST